MDRDKIIKKLGGKVNYPDFTAQDEGRPVGLLENEQERVERLLLERNPSLVYNELLENVAEAHSSNVVIDFLGMKEMVFFLKNWETPTLSLQNVGGYQRRVDGPHSSYIIKLPGDEIEVGNVTLTFFCDEKLVLYEKMANLLYQQSQRLIEYLLLGTIYFFDNVHSKCFFKYILIDSWITSLGSLKGNYGSPEDLEFDVTFAVNVPFWSRNEDGV